MILTSADKITVENVNTPGRTGRVDRAKYAAMHSAIMAVLPDDGRGLTGREIIDRVIPLLPDNLYPAGRTAGWWVKCVELDLEAKGKVTRHPTRPLTYSKA